MPKRVAASKSVEALMCGLGAWRPSWLQSLANHYAYSVAFILVGIIQGMAYTYFNGIVTTVEKAFQVDSSTMGYVLAGNDISQILCGLVLTHVANRGNRPFWMAVGILIGALSCFIYASTQLFWQESSTTFDQSNSSATSAMSELCSMTLATDIVPNVTCNGADDRGASNLLAACWLFLGQFVSGIGGTATFAVGFAYMDDNIKKHNSPLYIGLTSSMRSLGPTLGYVLASFCLNIYIDPNDDPGYGASDPRWLGAWWLGFLIIGILQALFALPVLLFPRELPSKKLVTYSTGGSPPQGITDDDHNSMWADLLPSLKRLTINPIIMLNILAFGFFLIPFIGISTFKPKYLEAKFGQTASQASIQAGLSSTGMAMFGVFLGGVVIWKFRPGPMLVSGWVAVVDATRVIGLIIVMNLDCNDVIFHGVKFINGRTDVTSECSRSCDCGLNYEPVCVGQQNFLSPCLAGCTTMDATTLLNATKNVFSNCSCADSWTTANDGRSGVCEDALGMCPNLWTYLIVFSVLDLISTSARVGCILIIVRCVAEKDKGVALTLLSVTGSIMGFIPGPIIYGAAVDSTCLVWKQTPCGEKGNCSFYDVDAFSYWFHGLGIMLGIVTVLMDSVVVVYSRHINLYDDDDEPASTSDEPADTYGKVQPSKVDDVSKTRSGSGSRSRTDSMQLQNGIKGVLMITPA